MTIRSTEAVTIAAAGLIVAVGFACPAAAAQQSPGVVDFGLELLTQVLSWATGHARAIIASAYDRAPTLMIVLAALLIVPLTALTGLAVHGLHAARVARRERHAALEALHAIARTEPAPTTHAVHWPSEAWVTADMIGRVALPRGATLLRIGRHDDNDIRLPDRSIHRHHAILHRTAEGAYVVMDLSGKEGNGVLVNDVRRSQARLADGDRIRLGDVILHFETKPL